MEATANLIGYLCDTREFPGRNTCLARRDGHTAAPTEAVACRLRLPVYARWNRAADDRGRPCGRRASAIGGD